MALAIDRDRDLAEEGVEQQLRVNSKDNVDAAMEKCSLAGNYHQDLRYHMTGRVQDAEFRARDRAAATVTVADQATKAGADHQARRKMRTFTSLTRCTVPRLPRLPCPRSAR